MKNILKFRKSRPVSYLTVIILLVLANIVFFRLFQRNSMRIDASGNSSWFRTWNGDVYSSDGATQSIPYGVPWNPVFSNYMCYNRTGQFTVGLGCFNENLFESQPTSIFSINLNDDASVETKTNAEFDKIKNKLSDLTDGYTFTNNGVPVIFYDNLDDALITNNRVVYLETNLTIEENIRYSAGCTNERSCSLLIVVDGDVTIGPLVEHIDAFIIASGRIIVESSYMND